MDKRTVRLFYIAGVLFLLSATIGFFSGESNTYWVFAILGIAQFVIGYTGSKRPVKKVTIEESKKEMLDKQLIMLLADGQKMTAIKIFREMTHSELKEASDYVDELENAMKVNK